MGELYLFEIDHETHYPVTAGISYVIARDVAHARELFESQDEGLEIETVTKVNLRDARVLHFDSGEY